MSNAEDHRFENTANSTRPVIAKWPFILGDVILVAAALTLWGSVEVLSVAQIFFCLGSVGLGALLFAAPYVIESFPALAAKFSNGMAAGDDSAPSPGLENELHRQVRAAAEAVEHAARANAALESSARRFDARFAPLVEIQKNLETVVNDLREAAATRAMATADEAKATQREFERLRKEQAEKFKMTESKIAALSDTLAVLAANLKTLSAHPASLPSAVEAPARVRAKAPAPTRVEEPVAVRVAEPVLAGVGAGEESGASLVEEISVAPVESAPVLGSISAVAAGVVEAPVEEKKSSEGESMLAKALATVQPASESPAVADIIQSRPRRSRKSKPHLALGSTSVPTTLEPTTPEATTESAATPATSEENEGWQALSEKEFEELAYQGTPPVFPVAASSIVEQPLPEAKTEEPAPAPAAEAPPEESASSIRRSARAKALALRGEEDEEAKKNTPVVFSPARTDEAEAKPTDGPTQGELLAREAETIRKKRSSRGPVHTCTLTARVLIGIGNKPFVRGTGPGLSNEKGVPMEFVEIGQWRWAAPGAVKEPITLRILKNDEIPAEGEQIILQPGQSLDVSPVFPG